MEPTVLARCTGPDPACPPCLADDVRGCLSFQRAARMRHTTNPAAPTETGQVRMMRDAVLSTSRLTEQLTQAQAILRDPN